MVPQAKQEVQGEAKLLFAGMIRAINNLLLSCHKDSDCVNRIKHAVQTCSVEDSIAENDNAEKDSAEKDSAEKDSAEKKNMVPHPAAKRDRFAWLSRSS